MSGRQPLGDGPMNAAERQARFSPCERSRPRSATRGRATGAAARRDGATPWSSWSGCKAAIRHGSMRPRRALPKARWRTRGVRSCSTESKLLVGEAVRLFFNVSPASFPRPPETCATCPGFFSPPVFSAGAVSRRTPYSLLWAKIIHSPSMLWPIRCGNRGTDGLSAREIKFTCARRLRMRPKARPRKKLLRQYRDAWSAGGVENDRLAFVS
jgi:hypothetical protein